MIEKRCINCMKIIPPGTEKCPYCGFEEEYYQAEVYQLPIGSVLEERYQIGRVIGEGGFGVTYIGWDNKFNQTVAVKEFYIKGIVSRFNTVSYSLTLNKKSDEEQYQKSLFKVEQEAKILKQFASCPGIVRVEDFFRANNTVYIVMEYVEGLSLREYCKQNRGRLDGGACLEMFRSLIEALYEVHKRKIIHRDISPDNIMVQKDGTLKLLDFGSARSTDYSTTSVTVKYGYAPLEQYHADERNQGPWIDVYALCASIYYCLTGNQMQDSQLRRPEEDIWTDAGEFKLSRTERETLRKGLQLDYRERLQSMDELYFGLYGKHLDKSQTEPRRENQRKGVSEKKKISHGKEKISPKNKMKKKPEKSGGKRVKRIFPAVLVLILSGTALYLVLHRNDTEGSAVENTGETEELTTWARMDETEETEDPAGTEAAEGTEDPAGTEAAEGTENSGVMEETKGAEEPPEEGTDGEPEAEQIFDSQEIMRISRLNEKQYKETQIASSKQNDAETDSMSWTDEEGNVYTAEKQKNGRPDGQGTCSYANGDYFVGQWVNGEKSDGTFQMADGTIYEGAWGENGYAESGTVYYTDGSVYQGKCVYTASGELKPDMSGLWYFSRNDSQRRESFQGEDFHLWGHLGLENEIAGTLYYTDGTTETGKWKLAEPGNQENLSVTELMSGPWTKIS